MMTERRDTFIIDKDKMGRIWSVNIYSDLMKCIFFNNTDKKYSKHGLNLTFIGLNYGVLQEIAEYIEESLMCGVNESEILETIYPIYSKHTEYVNFVNLYAVSLIPHINEEPLDDKSTERSKAKIQHSVHCSYCKHCRGYYSDSWCEQGHPFFHPTEWVVCSDYKRMVEE